jgi:hypothetical protein
MSEKIDVGWTRRKIGSKVRSTMGEISPKTKTTTTAGAILHRRRSPVASFRRDRKIDRPINAKHDDATDDRKSDPLRERADEPARAVPVWGQIVLRSSTKTLR